ncbi:MAG: hypothetical protein KBF93_11775 [Leptospiraceae bacterium]|nr:hypothetical protein [Leptospiraceae bacterium]
MQIAHLDKPLIKQPHEYNEKELLAARKDNASKFLQAESKAGNGKLILLMLRAYQLSPSIEYFLNSFPKNATIARAIVDLSEDVYCE